MYTPLKKTLLPLITYAHAKRKISKLNKIGLMVYRNNLELVSELFLFMNILLLFKDSVYSYKD